MGWLLFGLFTLVPLLEVFLLVQIGGVLGVWPTLAVVVVTGGLGAFLAKAEGRRALARVQSAFAEGRMPEEEVAHGALVLVGGTLLVTPGVLTDVVGLSLLIRPIRGALIRVVGSRIRAKIEAKAQEMATAQAYAAARDVGFGQHERVPTPIGDVIEMVAEVKSVP